MKGKLWLGHAATPAQRELAFRKGCRKSERLTQADLLAAMLREKKAVGKPVDLPAIMAAGIAQHGARFNELRSRGLVIENQMSREGGAIHSRYFLKFDPELEGTDGR